MDKAHLLALECALSYMNAPYDSISSQDFTLSLKKNFDTILEELKTNPADGLAYPKLSYGGKNMVC